MLDPKFAPLQGREGEAGLFHGVLHVTIHEAADLPGDPTMLSVCHMTDRPWSRVQ